MFVVNELQWLNLNKLVYNKKKLRWSLLRFKATRGEDTYTARLNVKYKQWQTIPWVVSKINVRIMKKILRNRMASAIECATQPRNCRRRNEGNHSSLSPSLLDLHALSWNVREVLNESPVGLLRIPVCSKRRYYSVDESEKDVQLSRGRSIMCAGRQAIR